MSLAERLTARPSWERRTLALGFLALAALAVWAGLMTPLQGLLVSQDDWRAQVRHELAHARGKAASESALRKADAALAADPIWREFFAAPRGQDPTAQIQRDVQNIGMATGVTVQAMTSLPRVTEGGLSGYGVRFTSSATADQLQKLMDAVRGNPRYLRVERLSISAPQLQKPDDNAALVITVEIFGYTQTPESGSGTAAKMPWRGPL